jgi:hypothetical protein
MNACYTNEANLDKPLLALFTRCEVQPWEELSFSYTGYDSDEEVRSMFHCMMWLSLILSRMMRINMPAIMEMLEEMLYMHPVCVGPESVKDTCLSKPSIVLYQSVFGCSTIQLVIHLCLLNTMSLGPWLFVK